MRKLNLIRCETGDEGTFGAIFLRDKMLFYTLELPYRDMDKDGLSDKFLSCLPAGTYGFYWVKSPKRGWCYEAAHDDEAPNRDKIQIHSANFAGDVKKGYYSELEGCIALGSAIGEMTIPLPEEKKQKGIARSKKSVEEFNLMMKNEPFELCISWGEGAEP